MGDNKEEKKTLKTECSSPEALVSYLEHKANNHRYFKKYCTEESLNYMIEQKSLFLSTGKNWNDKTDKKQFNPDTADVLRFGGCFSVSQSESVAMWMLYGGTKRRGVMVDFTKEEIKACLNSENVALGIWEGNQFKKVGDSIDKSKFSIQLIDILYVGESKNDSNNYYYVKRSNETHHVEKNFIDSMDCFKKILPWNYENECRLVLTIDKKHITKQGINSAKIELPATIDKPFDRIYSSPNYAGNNKEFLTSHLSAKLDWDLCKECTERS